MGTTCPSVNLTLPKPKNLFHRSAFLSDSTKTPYGLSVTAVHPGYSIKRRRTDCILAHWLVMLAWSVLTSEPGRSWCAPVIRALRPAPYFSCATPHTYPTCPSPPHFCSALSKLDHHYCLWHIQFFSLQSKKVSPDDPDVEKNMKRSLLANKIVMASKWIRRFHLKL